MFAKPSALSPWPQPPLAPQGVITVLEQLYRERALMPYRAGQTITLPTHEILIICRGIAQLCTIQQDGGETLLGLVGPAAPIGLPLTTVDPYWVTALTDVDLLPLSLAEVEASPLLMAGLCRHVMLRLQQSEAWLALSGKRLVADRLRQILRLIAQDFGQVEPQGVRIPVRLTHHQLAIATGTTRVTVTRLLKDFKREGWLSIHHRYFILSLEVVEPLPSAFPWTEG